MVHKYKILYLGLDPTNFKGKGTVIHFPVIEIVPLHFPIPHWEVFSHILLTSKTVVHLLGESFQRHCASKSFIAIGQFTAKAALAVGLKVTQVCEDETQEGVISLLKTQQIDHLFYPHSKKARSLLAAFLNENKIPHTDCILYDTLFKRYETLPNLNEFNEVIFTSPSTVAAFAALFNTLPPHLKVRVQGPITQKEVEKMFKVSYSELV